MIAPVALALDGDNSNSSHANGAALAGRVLMAIIFVLSGVSKLADPAGTMAYIGAAGLPFAPAGFTSSVVIEIGGGIALMAGYRVRLVAAALTIFSLLTASFFHSALSDQNQFIHFFKNVAMAGGLLQVVAFGGGRYSLDARRLNA